LIPETVSSPNPPPSANLTHAKVGVPCLGSSQHRSVKAERLLSHDRFLVLRPTAAGKL